MNKTRLKIDLTGLKIDPKRDKNGTKVNPKHNQTFQTKIDSK